MLFADYSRGNYFDGKIYADTILAEALKFDVMRSMMGYFAKYDDGIKTNYMFRKRRCAKEILKELKTE